MNKGTIVWQGTPDELLANEDIQHKYLGVSKLILFKEAV